jgi:hypothetical protein
MVVAAELNTLAVAGALARPDDDVALGIARCSIAVLEHLGDCLRGLSIPEAVMEEERQRAYAQGAADCRAARCRLEVLPGGQSA